MVVDEVDVDAVVEADEAGKGDNVTVVVPTVMFAVGV